MRRAAVMIAGFLALAAGCVSERKNQARQDTVLAGVSDEKIEAVFDTAPATGPQPRDTVDASRQLQFTQSAVKERLRAVGIDAVDGGAVRQPFLGPEGRIYRVPGGELQAYIYGDAVALARDTDRLDTLRVAPPGMMISWIMPPALIIANNLAAILLTRDESLRRRIQGAFKPY